jgi:TPR repeat protein
MGTNQDYNMAIEWFKKAAAQGDEDAIRKLKELKVK